MKEKVFVGGLFTLELLFFVALSFLFGITDVALRLGLIWFIILFLFKHYNLHSTLIWNEIEMLIKAYLIFILIAAIIFYPNFALIIKIAIVGILGSAFSLLVNRMLRIVFRNTFARKTLIIGTGADAYHIYKVANRNRFALTKVVGFIKVPGTEVSNELAKNKDIKVYSYNRLEIVIEKNNVDQIAIAIPDASHELLDLISRDIYGKAKYIKVVPRVNFTMALNSYINDFDGVLMISTSRGIMNRFDRFLKRCVDICAGIVGCLLLVPLTIYVKHANKKSGDTNPIIFTQERIGKYGKPIKIYKYRSMIPNAEQVLEELMANDPAIREEYLTNKKIVNDPRITKVGAFLRRTSLDEFPQFINVLKGEMSLVGPRPYLPREKNDMDIYYESIIQCKPGITGMWQANGRSDVGFIDRCKLDDFYYKNYSIKLDLILVYKTIRGVIHGKGAM